MIDVPQDKYADEAERADRRVTLVPVPPLHQREQHRSQLRPVERHDRQDEANPAGNATTKDSAATALVGLALQRYRLGLSTDDEPTGSPGCRRSARPSCTYGRGAAG